MLLATAVLTATATHAQAETRTLKLYFIHTKEKAEITYKKNGRYIQSGLNEVNRFLRDWRRNEPTKMDPKLLDIVWEAYKTVGARDYIHVVSAYRSPATNSMLRSRSKGVAKNSQHTLGKAMDFYIPGVKLSTLRATGLKIGAGGVGYYPTSGSPFVHFDVGSVRHWPRMSRKELVAVFPNGGTLHVPSDGKPLPGYNQALASYKARGRSGATIQVANDDAGSSRSGSGRGFLAALFGGGADEEEESSTSFETIARATGRNVPAAAVARNAPEKQELPGVAVAATFAPAAAPEPQKAEPTPEQIIASLPIRSIPLPVFASRAVPESAALVAAAPDAPAPLAVPAEQPTEEEVVVAMAVPTPTARPAAELAAAAEVPELAAAKLAEPAPAPETPVADAAGQIRSSVVASLADTQSATPSRRPADPIAEKTVPENDAITLAAFAPVPQLRPSGGPFEEMIAGMPVPRPEARDRVRSDAVGTVGQKPGKGSRVAGQSTAPSQRAVLLASNGNVDPLQAIASEVKTTGKSAKPGPQDLKADRKPVVIPVEEVQARWALERSGRLTRAIASAKEPSLAHHAIRTSPRQVYTSGFVPVMKEPDPARFSGNAVTFLSVATFDAN
ncbi:DUF882 domain-containing protein [Aquibium oceanicum]|uniref:Murein endopeptidase K n=1 Tax=Aquibium oceanicum TaxID=1670800 RepID=A0A1L3SWC6_9HYPH|nr:DUF882 domain-containing protein [Aquibium oceanicum]APH73698.1 hypothetical protein BSQ44_21665 [Aquibium oceanicum]